MTRLVPFALLLAAWWAAAKLGNEFVTPTPARTFARARELGPELLDETAATLGRVLLAFALALVAGVAIGTLIGSVRMARDTLRPLVSFLFPTPKIALYPALVIAFGLGSASKVALGFAEALFPILLATAAGTSQVTPQLRWSAASLGTRRIWLRVTIPAALPSILTGARIGLVGAIVGVFLAEMIAGADGLGHQMAVAYRTLDTPAMYVALVTVSIVGLALDRALALARTRLLSWA